MNTETHTIDYLEASAASYENLAASAAEGMRSLTERTGENLAQIEDIAAKARDISERLQAMQAALRANGTRTAAAATTRNPSAGESFALAWDHFLRGCKSLAQRN